MDNIHYLTDNATPVRCANCTRRRQAQRRTKKVCRQCPRSPGLCSAECFNEFHMALGFELLPAAIKRPGSTTKSDRSKDKTLHYVVHKQPTECNEKPRGKCNLCSKNHKRKDTYFECNYCRIPFCNNEHLMEHHRRMGILDISDDPSSEEETGTRDFSTQTEDTTTQTVTYEFQRHDYYQTQTGPTPSFNEYYNTRTYENDPAPNFNEYYYSTRTYANDTYVQWPTSSTPLNLAFQSTVRGDSNDSPFELSVTPVNDSFVSLDSATNLRSPPIGPRTPPELDQAEVPLDANQDSSSQCKQPRSSESPRQSPKRHGSKRQRTQPELDLPPRRSARINKAPVKPPVKPKREAKTTANRPAKKIVGGKYDGVYEGVFTDDEETAGKPPTKPTKPEKEKNPEKPTTSEGHPGLNLQSLGPTKYSSDSESDIDIGH